MKIPEGWPTREMIDAADAVCHYCEECKTSTANPLRVWEAMFAAAPTPPAQHSDDDAVDSFASAMKEKLAEARTKGRGGWDDPERCSIEHLQSLLNSHLTKGDPVDVGNFAMMLHQRGGSTTPPAQEDEPVAYAAKNYRNGKWGYIWHEQDDVKGWINLQHQSRDDVTYTGPIALYTRPQSDSSAEKIAQMLEAIKEVDVLIRNSLPVDKTTPAWGMIKKILDK